MPGRRVFDGIVDEFLDNAKEVDGILVGHGRFESRLVKVDGTAAGAFHVFAQGADTGFERVGEGVDRHEAAGDAADGFDHVDEVGVHAGDEGFGFGGVSFGPVEAVEVEAEDGEALDEVVVEFGAHFGDDLFGGVEGAPRHLRVEGHLGFKELEHKDTGFLPKMA